MAYPLKKIAWRVAAQYYHYDNGPISIPYSRNDFYKIWLVETGGVLHLSDSTINIDRPALFFANPLLPYAFDSDGPERSGYWCVFKKDFLDASDQRKKLLAAPLFNTRAIAVFFPDDEQLETLRGLFKRIIAELNTSFEFKYDVARNYIYLLLYEGLKIQAKAHPDNAVNAATRITNQFLDLLERQFPIQSPEQSVRLKKAHEFAAGLSVHVNHLNAAVKGVTGKPTSTVIAERIISEGKVLLKQSDWNIADIAYSLGFDYPNHFNTFFKKHTGATPLSFRNTL
jgi:AraC family transcriptional regulator, transcriptional activator of pobA